VSGIVSIMHLELQESKRSQTKSISIVATADVVNRVERQLTGRNHGRKYGTGKNSEVLLEPQPSDSAQDPLVSHSANSDYMWLIRN
jgi:hypothetical protein